RIERGRVLVTARSSIHDARTERSVVTGIAEVVPAEVAVDPRLAVEVDMTRFDAGDLLRNRKVRKDREVDRHHLARVTLGGLEEVTTTADGFAARVRGHLAWHDRSIEVVARGNGRLDGHGFQASATF